MNKYIINENYFNLINTEAKAYFLGLLYSDGNIRQNLRNFRLKLIEPDKHILDSFLTELESSHRLYYCNKGTGNHHLYSLDITNKKLTTALIDKGLFPNKSLTLKFPTSDQVPNNLIFHFIRGYFDGDGGFCISKNHLSHLTIHFCVSYDFGLSLQKFLNTVDIHSTLCTLKNNKIHKLSISGNHQCLKLADLMYQDAKFYLYRKYRKYLELKDRHTRIIEKIIDKKTSKFHGVYFLQSKKRYIAFVKYKNKSYRFGHFKNEIDAAIAYNNGIKNMGLIDRKLNII